MTAPVVAGPVVVGEPVTLADVVRVAGRDRYTLDRQATARRRAELAGGRSRPAETLADAVP